jgi:rhodanese-related sulfurtransferase
MSLQEIIKDPKVSIVDVRSKEEFASGHYPNAKNIPLNLIAFAENELKQMSKPIVFYCRSGNRSAQAVAYLQQHGFEKIYNGGVLEDLLILKNMN